MDLSQEFLIDLAINAGGYFAAAVLGMVMYSLFSRKTSAGTQPVAPAVPAAATSARRETGKIEFVRFGEQAAAEPRPVMRTAATVGDIDNGRRNRADVMDIARKMLNAGAPPERIRRVLPVSETELSLLMMNKS